MSGSLDIRGGGDGSDVGEAFTSVVGDEVAEVVIKLAIGLPRFAIDGLLTDMEDKVGVDGDAREREMG